MSIEAAAEALAPEPVAPVEPSQDVMTEDEALAAAYDAATQPEEKEDPTPDESASEEAESADPVEEPAEQAEDAEAAEEAQDAAETEDEESGDSEDIKGPTDFPKAVRENWGKIPDEARQALVESQRELNRKLTEQGRQMTGIAPIRDALVEIARDTPEMLNMRPEEVAQEFKKFRDTVIKPLNEKPLETVMQVIKERGLEEPLKQVLNGQQPGQESMRENILLKEIGQLKQQVKQLSDPNYIQGHVEQFTTQSNLASEVANFSQNAEHWADVESHMPAAIQFVKSAEPDLPPKDTLERAYNLAVSQYVPEAKATRKAGEQPAPQVDPKKTEAAIKAKSVNVKGKASDKSRKLTEDELLARAYDKAQE